MQEFKRRVAAREAVEGKEVPDAAVINMKANFVLPEVSRSLLIKIINITSEDVFSGTVVISSSRFSIVMILTLQCPCHEGDPLRLKRLSSTLSSMSSWLHSRLP